MKPILFNTEMVQAILSGRKTATRRIVKPQPVFRDGETGTPEPCDDGNWCFKIDQYHDIYDFDLKPPYQRGDILYVRETWQPNPYGIGWPFFYKASPEDFDHAPDKWRPSIHMPKDAARIFLRVTNVRMEKLQFITESDARKEGVLDPYHYCSDDKYWETTKRDLLPADIAAFSALWDSTIKSTKCELYGWDANPWVWVFEYELCKKPIETE